MSLSLDSRHYPLGLSPVILRDHPQLSFGLVPSDPLGSFSVILWACPQLLTYLLYWLSPKLYSIFSGFRS
ncbi:hypothetical protein HanXRQr2_Chr01g0036441 [Helianthus annuus]|uniref:Uncharacterized protein n=1 Tax=Helianthus annuus TaxID=4232 RepID=A0A9K3JYA3_HELAN|nr:hypothetical protein HanXRQr2_Chr01g0036441 [Helianthus annuus]